MDWRITTAARALATGNSRLIGAARSKAFPVLADPGLDGSYRAAMDFKP
jgi:hypothetical protein